MKINRKIKKAKYVYVVSKKAHWSLKKANRVLNKINKIDMPYSRYVEHECWNLSFPEIKKLNKKIEKKEQKKKELTKELVSISSMKEKEAKECLEKAESLGIPMGEYVRHYLFELNDDELYEYSKEYRKKVDIKNKNNEFFIEQVCIRTGWSKEKALEEMKKMKKMGISFQKYVQKGIFGYDEEQLEHFLEFNTGDKERIKEAKEGFISDIMKATGWGRGKSELEVLKAKNICECSYEDYLGFRLWEITPEEQKEYVTLAVFDRLRIKYNEFKPMKEKFDDKAAFNKTFKKYIKRVWFTNDNLTYEEFEKYIKGLKKIIIKPLSSSCGVGVEAFECNKSKKQNKELYDHIMSLEESIIEEYVYQTKEMSDFCKTSVNTVRIYTIMYKNKCIPIYGLFRMGNGGVVDNFHANGCAAGIDVKTGVVETNAIDVNRKIYEKAPATGKKIKGFKIPSWDEIMDICQKASREVKGAGLVGWDFAITPKGIDLIEGNTGAYYVAQLVNVEDRKGLMPVMVRPYL